MGLSCIHFAAIGHIHQDTLAGLVDTQRFAFLVDMRNHQTGNFIGICGKAPLAQAELLERSGESNIEEAFVKLIGSEEGLLA